MKKNYEPRTISAEAIAAYLGKNARERLHIFEDIPSTNSYAKEYAEKKTIHEDGEVFIAKRQSAGRGRLGRNFLSDGGGLYLSYLYKPLLSPEKAIHATVSSAVAVAEVIEETTGCICQIKWVNDLIVGGKKAGGILTEGKFAENGEFVYAVIGIGINLFKKDFPEELKEIATDLESETDVITDINFFASKLIDKLTKSKDAPQNYLDEYRKRSAVTGKRVRIEDITRTYEAVAEEINDNGELIVKLDTGEVKTLVHGNLSVRIL